MESKYDIDTRPQLFSSSSSSLLSFIHLLQRDAKLGDFNVDVVNASSSKVSLQRKRFSRMEVFALGEALFC